MREREIINGRFEIERHAGAGGMGTVYRAIDRQTGAPVALKVLNAGHSPELAERFQREAALLAELRHPGIVRFVASGATPDGQAYLVMEWLEGEGLADRLARGTLSVAETIELGRRVASALSVAHARGVVHRDLKPGNLFLPGRDLARVVVLDFGIARAIESGQSLTSTGATLGSPGYLSPEQARGDKNLDTRADVFSLGCVLFRCLTGRAPFTGDLIRVMMATVLEPAPRAGSLREGIPPAVEDLLQRMLAKSPDGRPRDAAAVFAELGALAAAAASAARCGGSLGRAREGPAADHGPRHGGAPVDAGRPCTRFTHPPASGPIPGPSVLEPARPAPRIVPAGAENAVRSTCPSRRADSALRPRAAAPRRPAPLLEAPAGVVRLAARPLVRARPRPPYAPAAVPPAAFPPAPRRSGARRWVIAVVGVALLAAGAAAFFISYGNDLFGKSPPPVPAAKRKSR